MVNVKINDIDISNDVVLSSINYMHRIDEVFGTGSLQFESKNIEENIPPYSILRINDNVFCCSSEATFHFGRKSWFHNVSIIEATSLLSRFLVGSKAFSVTGTNTYDYEKIDILLDLMEQKYNITIRLLNPANIIKLFNERIEYVFTAGTTLFDALNEISKQYGVRFYVSEIRSADDFTISFDELSKLSTLELDANKLISIAKIQNAESYCKYLESEATNVIDTNQLTIVNNLYPKANDVKLSEDTLIIETPTKIAKLEKFEIIKVDYNAMETQIQFDSHHWLSPSNEEIVENNFAYWVQKYPFLASFYKNVYSKYYPDKYWFYSQIWVGQEHILYPKKTDGMNAGELGYAQIPIDYTSHILSKEQYDLLDNKDKPDYAYYTYGSNVIEGFNTTYKNDFWNTLLGNDNKPFLFEGINTDFVDESGKGFNVSVDAYISIFKVYSQFASKSPTSNFFKVSYHPITNPYLINTKKDTPTNENAYKPYSISFNKSSNYIDFDKMIYSMNIENQSLGKPEMVVEYDTSNDNLLASYKYNIKLDGIVWAAISSQTSYKENGQQITTFNLVSNYNKIADVISLNSQYNTLKNPLENIIERPIFLEINEQLNITNGKTWLGLKFYDYNDNLIQSEANTINILPITILSNDNEIYIYSEMLDNYSIGRNARYVSEGVYKLDDIRYVDDNNECYRVEISLFEIDGFSFNATQKLPVVDNATLYKEVILSDQEIILYKDAREKLTFTIKANNCIIK